MDNPCGEHGNCVDGLIGYTCTCNHGYTGDQCEVKPGKCYTFDIFETQYQILYFSCKPRNFIP